MRVRQLACLLLLVSAMGTAAGVCVGGESTAGGRYVALVLVRAHLLERDRVWGRASGFSQNGLRVQAVQGAGAICGARVAELVRADVGGQAAGLESVWQMRPPAAHAVAVHVLSAVPVQA